MSVVAKTLRGRLAGASAAVPDPQRGGRGHRDRDRSLDHRHRLFARARPADLSRRPEVESVLPMLVQTASLSGAILFIVGAASAMAWALTQSGFSHDLAAQHGAACPAALPASC